MKQNYFIVVLAHSLHGRLRRVHIPHQAVYVILALALVGCFSMFGFVSSYARMAWKVANYNALKREADILRSRYQHLQMTVNQTNEQLASLQVFANEVSVAYGMKQKPGGSADISLDAPLVPSYSETIEQYNTLKGFSAAGFDRSYFRRWHTNARPDIWPVEGRLMGSFGRRQDPFSGEGAYHTGVDISAPTGTPIRAAADGVVTHAAFSGGYGRLVVIDHGNGMQSYYAHLSRYYVLPGQEIRRGEVLGAVGSSGRATASHLHYEVRVGKAPVNPYRYLSKVTQTPKNDFLF
jgi:murein DD-endopeptidase MepM/ murein hydrolase activator NlpD